MKKTYVAPIIDSAGTVLRETMGGSGPTTETENLKSLATGRVGFYL
jgi:hypothetical protein